MATETISGATTTEEVVRAYMEAVDARDLDAAVALWDPEGVENIPGPRTLTIPDGFRAYFTELFAAFPDFKLETDEYTTDGDRCAVHYTVSGTFAGPGRFNGIEPTGKRASIRGLDLITVRDGLLVRNDAYFNEMDMARQLGLLPELDSPAEQRMNVVMNTGTKLARRLYAAEPVEVAAGVWLVKGGTPVKMMNAFLLAEPEGGVTVFDAGIKPMGPALAAAGAQMGGIRRVVLGNAHADHRGGAGALGAPVFCGEAEAGDVAGDGGAHYFDYGKLSFPPARLLTRTLMKSWDSGPLEVSGTLKEGDEVAGFEVVDLPGHGPGCIGLWRASDRLALSNDCFALFDPQTTRPGAPRVPHPAFNWNTERARESIRKLAGLNPATAWPGHFGPLTGDVAQQLERAAATT